MGQFSSTEVCTAPSCLHASSNILFNLAPHWKEMDPCTEFDKMVCWNFDEIHPEGTRGYSPMAQRNNRILLKILKGNYADITTHRSTLLQKRDANLDEYHFNMLRQGFQACMDTESQAKLGLKPLNDFFADIQKIWPFSVGDLQKKPDSATFDALLKVAIRLEKIGVHVWNDGKEATIVDPLEPTKAYPLLSGMATAFTEVADLGDEEKLSTLLSQINATFSHFYPVKIDATQALKLAQGLVEFEVEGGKRFVEWVNQNPGELTEENSIKNMSLPELASLAPDLMLDKLIAGVLPAGYKTDQVVVHFPNYWRVVNQFIKEQPTELLQAWIVWRVFSSLAQYLTLPKQLQELGLGNSAETDSDRESFCLTKIKDQQRFVLERFYIEQTYSEQGRAAATKMIEKIKAEFKKRLSTYSWMGSEAKQRAIKKVDNMIAEVGYSSKHPNIRDPNSLASYYSELNVTSNFFTNSISSQSQRLAVQLKRVVDGYDRHTWPDDAQEYAAWEYQAINAGQQNAIFMFAGISRAPLFHADLPQYAQYGALGSVIGHEIIHGFDNRGRMYDENARLQQWWDNGTIAAYEEKAKCFVNQYDKFEYEFDGQKRRTNGSQTLGENMSDAAGLSISYDAWQTERKSMPDVWDQTLPGLEEFTHEQLFFITYANFYCSKLTTKQYLNFDTDNHALDTQRIIGTTANSRAFKEAFKCPKKEPECEVW